MLLEQTPSLLRQLIQAVSIRPSLYCVFFKNLLLFLLVAKPRLRILDDNLFRNKCAENKTFKIYVVITVDSSLRAGDEIHLIMKPTSQLYELRTTNSIKDLESIYQP